MPLRPSLQLALLAVSDEVAELQRQGETVVSIESWGRLDGPECEVAMATDSAHEHGVVIVGFTDEGG
jgi:hypothetical protein